MPRRNLIIGTAGHIDHGKTELVKALTGKDTDRLAEEKERGISIDLGFAPLELSDGSVVGIVDVPGHENFVRNMMAGATGVDLVLLVVAADDGVMPQTREHLAILDFLGVSRGVVAITKTDLVEDDLVRLVIDEVSGLLEGGALKGSTIIPVSAVTGRGIPELRQELERVAREVHLKDEALPARLPVDRVFTLKGIGTVVTGTLWSGAIEKGEHLEISPVGHPVRVRSLGVHGAGRDTVYAGERVAANLAGVSKKDVTRGDVLLAPGYLKPTYMVDARVTLLKECAKPLKRGTRLRFHHGTRELLGRVYPLEGEAVAPGETRPCQLRLESKATCANGDRFVIRSYSPVTTIGGGTVIDAHPPKHRLRDEAALRQFKELESDKPDKSVAVYLSRARKPLSRDQLARESGLAPGTVEKGLEVLVSTGEAVALGDRATPLCLSSERHDEIKESIQRSLREFHVEKPLADGMAKETLKKKALASWDNKAAEIFLDRLVRDRALESHGKIISLPGKSATVTGEQESLIEEIIDRIDRQPASPPTLSELSSELSVDRQALSDLLAVAEKHQRAVRVSPELYFSPRAVKDIEATLRESVDPEGITVSEFRKIIGTSRKYALPLLEYFDRTKVTVRVGDVRRLR